MAFRLYEQTSLVEYYLKYRPRYNSDLFKKIVKFYEEEKGPECSYNLAVDVGCGSGQSTLPLSNYFTRVIGCDVSPAQLSHAPKNYEGVEFLRCASENLNFLEDNSVDMLTVGTAYHFFDAKNFNFEAIRVLKPGGVLSVFAYSLAQLAEAKGRSIYSEHRSLLLSYDMMDYTKMEDMYDRYELPFAEWKKVTNDVAIDMREQMYVPEFIAYLQSDHAWHAYLDVNPDTDHLAKMEDSLKRTDSSSSLSAPLFKDEPHQEIPMTMKSYGGIEPTQPSPGGNSGRQLGQRLTQRKKLVNNRKLVVDCVCLLALMGLVLMMIETEMFVSQIIDEGGGFSFTMKIFISASTGMLLVCICVLYYVDMQIKALDACVRDWHSVIDNWSVLALLSELIVCSIHPFPGDVRVTYTSPAGQERKVSINAVLSILMMARLYLVAKFVVAHSRLVADNSINSIGALSKIKIDTLFVFKAVMAHAPYRLLIFVMLTTFMVNSWAMRTCEVYYHEDPEKNTYMEIMWLIATTFLTVGYGDKIPMSYCGRYISVCTGIMGVGSTALLVAAFARNLEQTRSEKYVFNMVTRIQIEKQRKISAANVIKAVLYLFMMRKYAYQDKNLKRKFEDQLKTSLRRFQAANAEKAHVGELNVGIIEVSETVSRMDDKLVSLEERHDGTDNKLAAVQHRLTSIELKLDEIRSLLTVKR